MWPCLLGLDAWDATAAQRERSRALRLERFEQLVQRSDAVKKSDATVIDGDVPRTDRDLPRWKEEAALAPIRTMLMAHCAHEAASVRGYSQGMNDVAAVVLDAWLPMTAASAPSPSVATLSEAFWLFEALLDRTTADWGAGDEFAGVWRQTRCVAAIVTAASAKLGAHLRRIDETRGAELARDQPLACLFGCVLLRLKREMVSYEETRRLWEASWANHSSGSVRGRHFHLVVLAALVLSQRKALLRLPATTVGFAEMHRLFMQLASTQRAAPLLDMARALQRGNPKVRDAIEEYARDLPDGVETAALEA